MRHLWYELLTDSGLNFLFGLELSLSSIRHKMESKAKLDLSNRSSISPQNDS